MFRIVPQRLWSAEPLNSGEELESPVIDLRYCDTAFLWFRVTNAGAAADVKIEFAMSGDGVTFNAYAAQDDIITSTNTEFAAVEPEEFHSILIPRSAPFIQILVTEVGSNANNVVDADLWVHDTAG